VNVLADGPRPPRAVLLDRDGTVITETGYLTDAATMVLVPGAAAAIARLNARAIPVALVTNQSVVGRGLLDEAGLARVHEHLAALLREEGAKLDLVLSAYEHPTEGVGEWKRDSPRRKPNPGMLLEALEHFAVPPRDAWMVGDGARDLEAARRAGTSALHVLTGKGAAERAEAVRSLGGEPLSFADLARAVDWLLAR
jgi:D-glycero-D-manno-heptose 1,7-bisphosphate phosphatase